MTRMTSTAIVLFLVAVLSMAPVLADDAFIGSEATPIDFSIGVSQDFEHADAGEYKGWAHLWIRNNSETAIGDLHLKFITNRGLDITNVAFTDASLGGNNPVYGGGPVTWQIDNDVVGAEMDLWFYANPIAPGQKAYFSIYTDNTQSMVSHFSLQIYPTPVPEPGGILALSAGLLSFAGVALRRKR